MREKAGHPPLYAKAKKKANNTSDLELPIRIP